MKTIRVTEELYEDKLFFRYLGHYTSGRLDGNFSSDPMLAEFYNRVRSEIDSALVPGVGPAGCLRPFGGGDVNLKVLVRAPSATVAPLAIYPGPHRSKPDRGDHREPIEITIERDFFNRQIFTAYASKSP